MAVLQICCSQFEFEVGNTYDSYSIIDRRTCVYDSIIIHDSIFSFSLVHTPHTAVTGKELAAYIHLTVVNIL